MNQARRLTHMIEAIPDGAVPLTDDDFVRWARDNLFDMLEAGDQAVTGTMGLVNVTEYDLHVYSTEVGAIDMSAVSVGTMAIVTDSLGFVYGYQSRDPLFADKVSALTSAVEATL